MDLKSLVLPFYDTCLTVTPGGDASEAAATLERLLAPGFKSMNAGETKGKEVLIKQVQFFWKLIPDLVWRVEEMLQDGNRVVVRSTATGSPKGDFMGMVLDGTRSFRIMTIDIHTVVDGSIAEVYHLEEWTTAIKQLKGD